MVSQNKTTLLIQHGLNLVLITYLLRLTYTKQHATILVPYGVLSLASFNSTGLLTPFSVFCNQEKKVVLSRKVWVDFLLANFYRLTFKIVSVRPNHFHEFFLNFNVGIRFKFCVRHFDLYTIKSVLLSKISKKSKTRTDSILCGQA